MAKNMEPIVKRCRALGISPAVMGYSANSSKGNSTKRDPNAQKRVKKSEYAMQLNEKQKVKFIYGVLEKQFRKYYVMATKQEGIAGQNLLQILESRLDNVVFRLGLANTRKEARQIVNHGHILVNGHKVDIPSYLVKPGDVVAVREKSKSSVRIKQIVEENEKRVIPKWLSMDKNKLEGRVLQLADREDIDYDVEEHLIVELYSK